MSTEHSKDACMCDYGGRECCPLHVCEEDARMWERWTQEQDGLDGPPVTSEADYHA